MQTKDVLVSVKTWNGNKQELKQTQEKNAWTIVHSHARDSDRKKCEQITNASDKGD